MRHRYLAVAAVILVVVFAAVALVQAPLGAHAAPATRTQTDHLSHQRINPATHTGANVASSSCSLQYRWSIVPSPNLPVQTGDGNYLNAVTAITPNDAWAVGYAGYNNYGQALAEQWNGTAWSIQQFYVDAPSSEFRGVGANAANDVWAVGNYYQVANESVIFPLAAQWNGTNWTAYKLPTGTGSAQFWAVAPVSPSDVWAVGQNTQMPLVEHWNGTSWSVVTTPASSNGGYLYGITALAANDIWAVGSAFVPGADATRTLIEHWDGTAWTIVANPSPGGAADNLDSISALGANNIWAAGYEASNSLGPFHSLVEHWNGTAWTAMPNVPDDGDIFGLAAVSSTNVWTLAGGTAEHWNGSTWTISFFVGATSYPNALTPDLQGGLWAAGNTIPVTNATTLIEHEQAYTPGPYRPARLAGSAIICP